ncbi:MAG: hypothetical protein HUJ51_00490 [Eggerthellaceae bacterium]|nr:hypothetical protein [Eggerthellaceae bacterium]
MDTGLNEWRKNEPTFAVEDFLAFERRKVFPEISKLGADNTKICKLFRFFMY